MALSRFIIAGAANTGITYLLYLSLLQLMPYVAAYSVTYLTGIALGYVLNAYLVFKERPTAKSAAMYPFVCVMNYLFGLVLLYVIIELLGGPREIAPLIAIVVSAPVMYVTTKFIFKRVGSAKIVDQ